jgi:hypothetical protein
MWAYVIVDGMIVGAWMTALIRGTAYLVAAILGIYKGENPTATTLALGLISSEEQKDKFGASGASSTFNRTTSLKSASL